LENLKGLGNLTTIGDDLLLEYNFALAEINDLVKLTNLSGALNISGNLALTRLTGLDSIEAGSIQSLSIIGNSVLSGCAVKSVCDYLADPNAIIQIWGNATGCEDEEEIEAECEAVAIKEIPLESRVALYPNPAHHELNLTTTDGSRIDKVIIYSTIGQQVLSTNKLNSPINVSSLVSGLYLVELTLESDRSKHVLIIQ
jgi:hypothetical protein